MAARKYSGIFTASVTPSEDVPDLVGRKGAYTRFAAQVGMNGGPAPRVVMAFGAQLESVRHALAKGVAVDLAVQRDGGTIKIVGFPRPKAAAAA